MKKIILLIVYMIIFSFSVSASWQYLGNDNGVDLYVDSQDVRVEDYRMFHNAPPLTIKTKMKAVPKAGDTYAEFDVDFYETGWMKLYHGKLYHKGTGELIRASDEEQREQIIPGSIEDKLSKNLFAQRETNKKADELKEKQKMDNLKADLKKAEESRKSSARMGQFVVLVVTMIILELALKIFKLWGNVGFTFRCIFFLLTAVFIAKNSYYPGIYNNSMVNTIAGMFGANLGSMIIPFVITVIGWLIYKVVKSKS